MLFDQFPLLLEAARAGLGIGLLPTFLIEAELARGDLIEVSKPAATSAEAYYFAWPGTHKDHPPLHAFRCWILNHCKPSHSD